MIRWPRTADDALTVILLMLLAGTFVQVLVNVIAWSASWSWLDQGAGAASVLRQLIAVFAALLVPLAVVLLLRLPLTAPAGGLVALPAALWPVPSLLMDGGVSDPLVWIPLINCAVTLLVPVGLFAVIGRLRSDRDLRDLSDDDVYEPGL